MNGVVQEIVTLGSCWSFRGRSWKVQNERVIDGCREVLMVPELGAGKLPWVSDRQVLHMMQRIDHE